MAAHARTRASRSDVVAAAEQQQEHFAAVAAAAQACVHDECSHSRPPADVNSLPSPPPWGPAYYFEQHFDLPSSAHERWPASSEVCLGVRPMSIHMRTLTQDVRAPKPAHSSSPSPCSPVHSQPPLLARAPH
ncbi:unnamed protein product [Schistocephalus solidus]|uniref:Uncharacterized protein n=1 Tax=Schistocephalus solidus TaxID=70667 RepID=A0A183SJP3_SCHSO|nr:unnamed protein product [Schistocephalus solidus]